MFDFRSTLAPLIAPFVTPSPTQWQLLERHFDLLIAWNAKMNLSAIRDPEEIVLRHFAESLFLGPLISAHLSVVDIGSGGGFPGLPLAIIRQDVSVCLLEAHARKTVFLREASRNIPNVRVANERLESLRQQFDLAVCRGVSWAHLQKFLGRIVKRVMLLTTIEEMKSMEDGAWIWETPRAVPFGAQRLIAIGTVVSRGTC